MENDVVPAQPYDYPVTFSVEYPDRKLNRVSTAFRIFAAIPIVLLSALLAGTDFFGGFGELAGAVGSSAAVGGAGTIVLPVVLMILIRNKYPRWWFDWNLELLRFTNRIAVYVALMDDRYPSTDEEQAVRLDYPYPNVADDLERGMPLVKWLLAIPHYFVLFFLGLGAFFAVIGAWFAILFTGRYPRGIFNYVEGVLRWNNRVTAYALVLVTDEYPPFQLKA